MQVLPLSSLAPSSVMVQRDGTMRGIPVSRLPTTAAEEPSISPLQLRPAAADDEAAEPDELDSSRSTRRRRSISL